MKTFLFLFLIYGLILGQDTISKKEKLKQKEKYWPQVLHYSRNVKKFFIGGQYDSSIVYAKKACTYFKKNNIWDEYLRFMLMLGRSYELNGQLNNAIETAIKIEQVGNRNLGKGHKYVLGGHQLLGNIYFRNCQYKKALKVYFRLLDKQKSISPKDRKLHKSISHTYNNIALVYREKGELIKALDIFKKSLTILLETKDPNDSQISSQIADRYKNIGSLYMDIGDYFKSLEYYKKALNITLKTIGEKHPSTASIYNNIATVFKYLGDNEKSIAAYKKALNIQYQTLRKNHPDIAITHNNIGNLYFAKKNYLLAEHEYKEALKVFKANFTDNNIKISNCYNNLGEVYIKMNKYNLAFKFLRKAISINKNIFGNKHYNLGKSYLLLGELYTVQKKYFDALIQFQNAIISNVSNFHSMDYNENPKPKIIVASNSLLEAIKAKAFLLDKYFTSINDKKASFSTYDLAIQIIDKIRTGYKSEGSKLFLGEQTREVFEGAISVALELYNLTGKEIYKRKAFEFSEKSKAAVLSNSLQESFAENFSGIPKKLRDKEYDLRVDLSYYETELQKEKTKKENTDSTKIMEFENKFFDLKQEYDRFITNLEKNYPRYYSLKYKTDVVPLTELQNSLDKNTSLLEYFVGDSTVYIFVISKNDFNVRSFPKTDNFEKLCKDYYFSLKQNDKKNFFKTSSKLQKILIEPIKEKLKEKIVIIPDGILHFVPFESFVNNSSNLITKDLSGLDYLIKHFDISYNYSAKLFVNNLKSVSKGKGFIGFAPVFKTENNSNFIAERNYRFVKSLEIDSNKINDDFRSVTIDGKTFNELPYSETEINSIVNLFKQKGKKAIGYFNNKANEKNFKTDCKNYKYVHIATHGLVNGKNPKLSGLIFAQSSNSDDNEDGILYSAETYNLNLNADLVVLSSCKSGIGKIIKGEGMMALTRGFLYSGARNILTSLWNISDKTTKDLMIEFYKNIINGKNYSNALRNAKLKIMNKKETAFPGNWSGFVLIGI